MQRSLTAVCNVHELLIKVLEVPGSPTTDSLLPLANSPGTVLLDDTISREVSLASAEQCI